MKIRVFGSKDCKNCLKVIKFYDKMNINFEYINAFDENDEIQILCDLNDVEELPHIQIMSDKEVVVKNIVGYDNFLNNYE